MNAKMESRGRVFSEPYCCGWPISIPNWDSVPMKSPDGYEHYDSDIRVNPNWSEGRALDSSPWCPYDTDVGKSMQRYHDAIGRFRVLQCYHSYNATTFTEYAGLLETIPEETRFHFHSEQKLEIGQCYHTIRSKIVSLPDSHRTIRIAEAKVVTEEKT
jgi:hypothetical protein